MDNIVAASVTVLQCFSDHRVFLQCDNMCQERLTQPYARRPDNRATARLSRQLSLLGGKASLFNV